MKHLSIILLMILGSMNMRVMGNSPVTMQISRTDVTIDEVFQVIYEIVTHTETAPNINVPSLKGCTLLDVSAPQTDMRYTTDPRISTDYVLFTRYVYTYRADRKGKFKINPATVNIGGDKFKSNSGSINIIADDAMAPGKGDIFMKLELSTHHATIGEPVTLSVMLYSRWRLEDYTSYGVPTARNCTIDRVPTGVERRHDEIIDGTIYGVWVLERYVLTPSRSGKITVTPPLYGIAPDYNSGYSPFSPRVMGRRFAYTPNKVTIEVSKTGSNKDIPAPEVPDAKQQFSVPDTDIIYVMATQCLNTFHQL